jgi:cytochrome c oxidase subunit 1
MNPAPFSRVTSTPAHRLGLLHLAIVGVAAASGSLLALVLRFADATEQLEVMRAHGALMTFLVLVPAIPTVLGNLMLPEVLGQPGLAFPRLGAWGVGLHFVAFALFIVAAQTGGATAGWQLYMAYSPGQIDGSVVWLLLSLVAASATALIGALRIVTSVLASRRAPGASERTPALAAGLAASSALLALASPLALATLLLALLERFVGLGVFDPTSGGDPLYFAESLWFVTNAGIVSATVGALAVVAHLLDEQSERAPSTATSWTFFALALAGGLGGGQHLGSVGTSAQAVLQTGLGDVVYHALLLTLVVRWLATWRRGASERQLELGFVLAFVATIAVAAPAGLLLALPGVGTYLDGTPFAAGRLHYVAVGGVLFALLAGLHHVWPALTGRRFDVSRSSLGIGALWVGANLAFLPMLAMGAAGIPRPIPHEVAPSLQIFCTAGACVTVLALALLGWNLVGSLLPREPEPETAPG